jgi:hypothetical protein
MIASISSELDGDQHGADRHAGLQRDGVGRVRLAAQRGEGRPAVGEGVDADAEPGDAVAAEDADDREPGDRGDLAGRHLLEGAEVDDDDRADEQPQERDELALGLEVGLAGLVDQLGDLAHRLVHRHVLELPVDRHAEGDGDRAHHEADREDRPAGHAEELDRTMRALGHAGVEVGEDEVGLGVDLVSTAVARPRRCLRSGCLENCVH